MIVATHGRSIWILDDATPLQKWAEASKTDAYLFDIRPARQFNPANDRGFVTDKPFFGKNPPYGALITYYLAREPKSVALRIRDAAGLQVRELAGNDLRDAHRAGLNRVAWDLRHQPLVTPAGLGGPGGPGGGGGGGFGGGGNNGPNVLPGEYRVTLVIDGKEVATKSVRVSGDPDMPMTDADRRTWHDTSLALHELQKTANDAAAAVATLTRQMASLEGVTRDASNLPADVKTAIGDVNRALGDLRRRLGVPAGASGPGGGTGGPGGAGGAGAEAAPFEAGPPQGGFGGQQQNVRAQIGQTKGQIMQSTSVPTAQQVRIAAELREDMVKVVADTNAAIAAVSALYDKLGLGAVKPAAPKPIAPLR
jgi:hypothetical protein